MTVNYLLDPARLAKIERKLDAIDQKLDRLLAYSQLVWRTEVHMAADLSQITQDVHANTDAVASVTTLITGLAAKIEELKNDPAALSALAAELERNNQSLADAVAANTALVNPPAPPAPTPEP